MKKWTRGLKLTKDSLDRIPIWVHFHNIPLEFWSEEGLSRIASAVGKPLYGDAATESCSRINFAKICVEVQADQKLIDSCDILFPDEQGRPSSCSIRVSYPWKPPSCSFCRVFGHSLTKCSRRPPDSIPASTQIVSIFQILMMLLMRNILGNRLEGEGE